MKRYTLKWEGQKTSPTERIAGPTPLARTPWTRRSITGRCREDLARLRWREALAPYISSMLFDLERVPRFLGQAHQQQVDALARALTLSDPGRVGDLTAIPAWRTQTSVGEEGKLFTQSQCTAADRADFLRWLGRYTARVTWQDRGTVGRTAPVAVTAAGRLMIHWSAIAWHAREDVPAWCREEVRIGQQFLYPTGGPSTLYRPWAEARDDLHVFMEAWSQEREAQGRHKPRRCINSRRNVAAARDMASHMLLIRAVDLAYPGEVDTADIAIMKTLDRILNAHPTVPKMVAVLQAGEDRAYLERGLSQVSESGTTGTVHDTGKSAQPPATCRRKL